ncbi:MAG: hypothetical protein HQL71_15935, partial [Magnetococcales bacterium]|nr:hypothetical protein [Magnetococcales bacterium]
KKPVMDPTPLAPNAEAPAPAVSSEVDAEIDAFESAADDEVVPLDESIEVVE